jgi:hypothetical protein
MSKLDTELKNVTKRDFLFKIWEVQNTGNKFLGYEFGGVFGKWVIELIDGKNLPKTHFSYLKEKHIFVSSGPVTYTDSVNGKTATKEKLTFVGSVGREYSGPQNETRVMREIIASAPVLPELGEKGKTWSAYWLIALLISQQEIEADMVKSYTEKHGNQEKLAYALANFRRMSPTMLNESYAKLHDSPVVAKTAKTPKTGKAQPVDTENLTAIGVALAQAETVVA